MSRVISWRQWRIVLDTCVLISALRSKGGTAAQIVEFILSGRITACMDFKMACEYHEVAMRAQHRAASALSETEMVGLLARLEREAEEVNVRNRYRPLSPDPADDMILDVAINGRVDAIVTHNLKHMIGPAQRFGIPVLTPGEFLKQWVKEN